MVEISTEEYRDLIECKVKLDAVERFFYNAAEMNIRKFVELTGFELPFDSGEAAKRYTEAYKEQERLEKILSR